MLALMMRQRDDDRRGERWRRTREFLAADTALLKAATFGSTASTRPPRPVRPPATPALPLPAAAKLLSDTTGRCPPLPPPLNPLKRMMGPEDGERAGDSVLAEAEAAAWRPPAAGQGRI